MKKWNILSYSERWTTSFKGADLTGADLTMAKLERTDLRGADLTGTLLNSMAISDVR